MVVYLMYMITVEFYNESLHKANECDYRMKEGSEDLNIMLIFVSIFLYYLNTYMPHPSSTCSSEVWKKRWQCLEDSVL